MTHLEKLNGFGQNSNYYSNGFSFEVESSDVMYTHNDNLVKSPNKMVLLNNRTGKELYFGGKTSYVVFHNHQLMELADKIKNAFGLEVHHYAEHNGGKKVLVAFKNNKKFQLAGHDVQEYVVVMNGHDGTMGVCIGGSGHMHRCSNIMPHLKIGWKFKHSNKLSDYLKEFEQQLDRYNTDLAEHYQHIERYVNVPVSPEIIEAAKAQLLGLNEQDLLDIRALRNVDPKEAKAMGLLRPTRKINLLDSLSDSVNIEINQLGSNLFGLWNGFTHYTTHQRKNADLACLNLFGQEAKYNVTALDICDNILETA